MELPPRKQWPGLFGLIIFLSIVLIVFQHYISSQVPLKHKITGIISFHREKRTLSHNPRLFCSMLSTEYADNDNGSVPNQPARDDVSPVKQGDNEIQNIVFLKGHRAAGTTFQNILFRFALTRNLNVFVNKNSDAINETGSQIDITNIVPLPKGHDYNILCNHVIFNKSVISKHFPGSTVYIGILRHPLYQEASSFYHYTLNRKSSSYELAFRASPRNPFLAFVNRRSLYEKEPPNKSFANNRQSVDFGFPVTSSFEDDKHDQTKISEFLEDVDKSFYLILIADMFDESLILLRRLLDWKMEDILYTKLSMNNVTEHLSDISFFSEQDKMMHQSWSSIDYALYNRFKEKLNNLIRVAGNNFADEVEAFREIQDHVTKFCTKSAKNSHQMDLKIETNLWSPGFCIRADFCTAMNKGEHEVTDYLRKRQLVKVKDAK